VQRIQGLNTYCDELARAACSWAAPQQGYLVVCAQEVRSDAMNTMDE
jgi:hypothetical protein